MSDSFFKPLRHLDPFASFRPTLQPRRFQIDRKGLGSQGHWVGDAPPPAPLSLEAFQRDIRIASVKWASQFGMENEDEACFRACALMLQNAGFRDEGPGKIHPVTSASNAREGHVLLDSQLARGLPVIVGIDHHHTQGTLSASSRPEHWVVVYGRHTDESGRTEYLYREPGTRHEQKSYGRLQLDPETGTLSRRGELNGADVTMKPFTVVAVRETEPASGVRVTLPPVVPLRP